MKKPLSVRSLVSRGIHRKRFLEGTASPSWKSAKLSVERLEARHLMAAAFFAPPEPTGSVDVQLVPLANVAAGTEEIVTFGLPFTRGSISAAQLGQVRVLKNGVEIPAYVEQLTPWRSIDDPGIDGQSVRVARIQVPYTFASLATESITVQWGGPARTLNRSTLQDPRLEWHTVTTGTFTAGDNVEEPDVLPVLPKEHLSKGLLDARTNPTDSAVGPTRDNPTVMDTTTFAGYTEFDYAQKNFFYTTINQNPGININYKTDAEPWLYDRSSSMYELYLRSGFTTALREAVRSADFYADRINSGGFFSLRSGDPKYAYNEPLAYTYWLLGDNRMLAPISSVVNAHAGTATRWNPNLSFWTERNVGYKLLANEIAYEVTGGTTFKNNIQTIVNDLVWHQNGAGGQLPANRVDGGLYHIGEQHDAGEVDDPNVIIASAWMSGLIVDPLVRVFGVWQNSQVSDFVVRMGNFVKTASKTDSSGQYGGLRRYPDYLMRADGTTENRSDTDVQHAMDVGAIAAWSTYFAELRGTPDASLRQLANDLYATYDVGVNYYTRPGTTDFNVSPPRKYAWEYKNSPSFSWALTGADQPNQPGTLQFSAAQFTVNESQAAVTITVTRSGGSAGSVSVNYATSNGTATAGSDYTATSGILTFGAGEISKTFTIPIINDAAVEVGETVTLTLSNPTGGASLSTPATATLTIESDDSTNQPVTVSLQQGVNGYAGTTDVSISNQYAQYTGGNGITSPNDAQLGVFQTAGASGYTIESLLRFSQLGIPTNANVSAATLTLNLDTWSSNAVIRGYYLAAPWSIQPGSDLGWLHRGTGQDWNMPGARGQGTDVIAGKSFVLSGIQAVGSQFVTVNLDPAVVQHWINDPSSNHGLLLVNETTGAVVRMNASEQSTASLRPKLGVTYTVGSPTPQPGALQLSAATYAVNENQGTATITVNRSGGSDGSVTVNYATSNGSATAGSDYTAAAGTLTFAAGETTKTFTIPITNDTAVEAHETVNITLSGPTGGATLGSQATATLTIVSDDVATQPGVLQFGNAVFNASETNASVTITVTRTGGSDGAVSVNYATSNGTATAGADYTAASGTLTLAAGETSKTFTISIINDTAIEGPETVNLTLSNPTGGATLGSQATATLTIASDDTTNQPTTVTLQQGLNGYAGTTDVSISNQYAQYNGGNGLTNFTDPQMGLWQLSGSSGYSVENLIRFSNLGVPAGSTVSGASLTLRVDTWAANAVIRGYYVAAPWSATPGPNGTQLGWLHRGTGQDWAAPGARGQGTDVLAGKSFAISGIQAIGGQNITVQLDPAVVQGWIDNPSSNQGLLLVNETTGAVVRLNTSEHGTATFRPKLSVTYASGTPTPQPGSLQLSTAAYNVGESGGSATITVTRGGGSEGAVSVNYATSNGTATAGSDYTAATGVLNFAAGETSKTFTIAITDDNSVEGTETFELTLSNPTGGATLGSPTSATFTITDNDTAPGVSLPAGFTQTMVATGISSGTAMAVAPDGRIFVLEQTGAVRVIKNGALLPTPAFTVPTVSESERGLLGITFDPNFATNGRVYVYYTVGGPSPAPAHNRISRFTLSGDVAVPGSETVLLDLPNTTYRIHNGGALEFGGDGKLYVAVGNDVEWNNAQDLTNPFGKILRINADGSIPIDNPFYNQTTGVNRAIWARGLRNPYTLDVQPGTGLMYINDVGEAAWEEINQGVAGANYGWPSSEGYTTNPQYTSPVYAYGHGSDANQGYAIVGGAFYNPQTNSFPSQYAGNYFYMDYVNGWISYIDPASTNPKVPTSFATGIPSSYVGGPVDLEVGPDGALYYLNRQGGGVFKIQYTAAPPPPPVGTFTNVTIGSGVGAIVNQKYQETPSWWLSGQHLIDLDNDNDLDLYLSNHGGGSVVALNNGNGVFTRTTTGNFPDTEIHQMYDINEDGKLDVSMTYQDGGGRWWLNNSTAGAVNFAATNITREGNTARSQVMLDFNGDGKIDWLRSGPPGLVVDLGNGNGSFAQNSLTFAVPDTSSNNNASFLPADFDDDGDIDLLVLTGGGYDNTSGRTAYWRNNGNQTFTDVTGSSGIPLAGVLAKGIGDYDQDGDTDFIAIENRQMPPVIYLNNGSGVFTKQAGAVSGVSSGALDYSTWGTAISTDFDNDGIVDILMNGKYYLKILRGTGGGKFTYMNNAWGIEDIAASAVDDGLSFGDFDVDGDLDIIGYDEIWPSRTLKVYRNDLAPKNWVNVRPVGLAGNKGAAGAKISIYAPGTSQLLWYEQVATYDFQVATSYYGHSETERHFGLGNRATVDVVVEFPSGHVTRQNNVTANQTVRIVETSEDASTAATSGQLGFAQSDAESLREATPRVSTSRSNAQSEASSASAVDLLMIELANQTQKQTEATGLKRSGTKSRTHTR
jgi:glucose/arabinose dehydrogenase